MVLLLAPGGLLGGVGGDDLCWEVPGGASFCFFLLCLD